MSAPTQHVARTTNMDPNDFSAISTSGRLPLAPAREIGPHRDCDWSPTTLAAIDQQSFLHWIAFVALYGPQPLGVTVTWINPRKNGCGRELPYFLATITEISSDATTAAQQLQWVDDFRYGLDHWNDALFANPSSTVAGNDGQTRWQMAPAEDVIDYACSRLNAHKRFNEIRNLMRLKTVRIKEWYNPDR